MHDLDFCDDYRLCSFSVVVFSYDLKNVGDIQQLAGKMIEIRGEVREYDDRAEIILENNKQLGGEWFASHRCPRISTWSNGDTSALDNSRLRIAARRAKRRASDDIH